MIRSASLRRTAATKNIFRARYIVTGPVKVAAAIHTQTKFKLQMRRMSTLRIWRVNVRILIMSVL